MNPHETPQNRTQHRAGTGGTGDEDEMNYKRYLRSRAWYEKRDKVKKRNGGICERCNYKKIDHVHHWIYPTVSGQEKDEDLLGVCLPCQEFLHNKTAIDPMIKSWAFDVVDINHVYKFIGIEGYPDPKEEFSKRFHSTVQRITFIRDELLKRTA